MSSESDNRRLMLQSLHQRIRDAEGAQESFVRLRFGDFIELIPGAGLNETQAAKLFARLVHGQYILFADTSVEMQGLMQIVWVSDLTDKGLITIGAPPDAQERLIAAFEAAIPRIEEDDGLDEPEKRQRVEWARHAIDLVKGVATRGAGDAIFNNLPL